MISMNSVMFFDIETEGTTDEDIINLLFPIPEKKELYQAPSNYKKKEAKVNWVEREYLKDLEKRENATKMGALDIDTAVIRSIGYAFGNDDPIVLVGEEKEILSEFVGDWNKFAMKTTGVKSCGFNSINYDWAVIMRRLAILGMNSTLLSKPNMNRYSGEIDLMNIAWNFGYSAGKVKPMKTLARILGIEVPADETSGADVMDLTEDELVWYNVSDVQVVREIFKKFNGIYL